MLSDPGLIASCAAGAGVGTGILLLVAAIRGVRVDPTAPPQRWRRTLEALRSRSLGGRVLLGAGLVLVVQLLTGWPVAAVCAGALVVAWPHLVGGARAEQTAIARLDALVIWTESLRDTVAAHASLEQAIPVSAEHAPALIRPALIRLAGQIRVRTPLDAALLDLAADLDDPGADLVVAALVLNVRRRGDRLAQVLSALASAAREDLDLRRRVVAGRAGLRRSVQIIVVLTVVFTAYLSIFAGSFMAPYDTAAGQVALALIAALFALSFLWLRRLSLTPHAQPFLERPGRTLDPTDLRIVAGLTGLSNQAAADLSRTGTGRGAGRW